MGEEEQRRRKTRRNKKREERHLKKEKKGKVVEWMSEAKIFVLYRWLSPR